MSDKISMDDFAPAKDEDSSTVLLAARRNGHALKIESGGETYWTLWTFDATGLWGQLFPSQSELMDSLDSITA